MIKNRWKSLLLLLIPIPMIHGMESVVTNKKDATSIITFKCLQDIEVDVPFEMARKSKTLKDLMESIDPDLGPEKCTIPLPLESTIVNFLKEKSFSLDAHAVDQFIGQYAPDTAHKIKQLDAAADFLDLSMLLPPNNALDVLANKRIVKQCGPNMKGEITAINMINHLIWTKWFKGPIRTFTQPKEYLQRSLDFSDLVDEHDKVLPALLDQKNSNYDAGVNVYKSKSSEFFGWMQKHEADEVWSLVRSGDQIITGYDTIKIWENGECIRTIHLGNIGGVTSLVVDDTKIIAGLNIGYIKIFDKNTGKERMHLSGHSDRGRWHSWIQALFIDGKYVISICWPEIKWWDCKSGECVRIHKDDFWSYRFALENDEFVFASHNVIRIFDKETFTLKQTIKLEGDSIIACVDDIACDQNNILLAYNLHTINESSIITIKKNARLTDWLKNELSPCQQYVLLKKLNAKMALEQIVLNKFEDLILEDILAEAEIFFGTEIKTYLVDQLTYAE